MLTKLAIKAMRQCDDVTLHYNGERSYIVAIKRRNVDEPFSRDIPHEVECETNIHAYGDAPWTRELKTAFVMLHSVDYNQEWKTIAALAREGDVLTLIWAPDGATNGYMRDHKLHGDTLTLRITRGDKKLEFRVQTGICENNTARMCRMQVKQDYLYSHSDTGEDLNV